MPERKSDQPHSIYTYSLDPVVNIQEKLGIIEGLRDFSHPFKFAQNVFDFLRTLQQNKKVGLLQNRLSKETKTSLDQKTLDEWYQIWSGVVYLHLILDEKSGQPIHEEIVLEKPTTQTELDEYYSIQPLKKFIPTEDKEQNNLLIRIGGTMPEKYAYEGCDILSLDTIGGCHDLMPKFYQCSVCGRLSHEAWFHSQEELESSVNLSSGYVTKVLYYKIRDMLFEALDDRWFELKANILNMAREINASSYENQDNLIGDSEDDE